MWKSQNSQQNYALLIAKYTKWKTNLIVSRLHIVHLKSTLKLIVNIINIQSNDECDNGFTEHLLMILGMVIKR